MDDETPGDVEKLECDDLVCAVATLIAPKTAARIITDFFIIDVFKLKLIDL